MTNREDIKIKIVQYLVSIFHCAPMMLHDAMLSKAVAKPGYQLVFSQQKPW